MIIRRHIFIFTYFFLSAANGQEFLSGSEMQRWLDKQSEMAAEQDDQAIARARQEILDIYQENIEQYGNNIFGINETPNMLGVSGLSNDEFAREFANKNPCSNKPDCEYIHLENNPLDRIFELLEVSLHNKNPRDMFRLNRLQQHKDRLEQLLEEAAAAGAVSLNFDDSEKDRIIQSVVSEVFDEFPSRFSNDKKLNVLIQLNGATIIPSDSEAKGNFIRKESSRKYIKWRKRIDVRDKILDQEMIDRSYVSRAVDQGFYNSLDVWTVKAFATYTMVMYEEYFGENEADKFYEANKVNDAKFLSAIMQLANKFEYSYSIWVSKNTGEVKQLPQLLDFARELAWVWLLMRNDNQYIPQPGISYETPCEPQMSPGKGGYIGRPYSLFISDCLIPRLENDQNKIRFALENRQSEFLYPPIPPSDFEAMLELFSVYTDFFGFVKGAKGVFNTRSSFRSATPFRHSSNMKKSRITIGKPNWVKSLRKPQWLNKFNRNSLSNRFKKKKLSTHFGHYKEKAKVATLGFGQSKVISVKGKQTTFMREYSNEVVAYQHYYGNRYAKYTDRGLDGLYLKNEQGKYVKFNEQLLGGAPEQKLGKKKPQKVIDDPNLNVAGSSVVSARFTTPANPFDLDSWVTQLDDPKAFAAGRTGNYFGNKINTISNKPTQAEIEQNMIDFESEVDLLPKSGESFYVYRGMSRDEARAIGILDDSAEYASGELNAGKIRGHIGDRGQALKYAQGNDAVLVEFELKPGSNELMFSPKYAAIGKSSKPLAVIAQTAEKENMGKYLLGNSGEGYVKGYFGIKPEDGGKKISVALEANKVGEPSLNPTKSMLFFLTNKVRVVEKN